MSARYDQLFSDLGERGEGAFVPFLMLGDPSPQDTLEIVDVLVAAGADALELGVPFSDPVADGPTIQASHIRGIDGGATVETALEQIRAIRAKHPNLPLGMLIYGNVAFTRGIENFYREFAEAGADSILLPDVPVREGAAFSAAAEQAGIDPIFIAPAKASAETLRGVATYSRGYIYAISRDGVTGTERQSDTTGLAAVVSNVQQFGGAPILLGFGISTPAHVRDAMAAGAAGVITGSAITKIIEKHLTGSHPDPARVTDRESLRAELTEYVSAMKEATKRG